MTYTYLKFAKKNTFQLDYSFKKKWRYKKQTDLYMAITQISFQLYCCDLLIKAPAF